MIILSKSNIIEAQGKVIDLVKGGFFKVELEGGHIVEAHVSGKMRVNNIRILPGDSASSSPDICAAAPAMKTSSGR